MIWTIIAILVGLWLLGVVFNLVGGIIHILLVVAAGIWIYKWVTDRNAKHVS